MAKLDQQLALRLAAPAAWHDEADAGGPLSAPVASAMRFPTIVSAETPLSRAAELFVGAGVNLVVVVDKRRRPLGVVSPADVLALASRLDRDELDRATALDAARSGGRFMPESTCLASAHAALLDENRDFFVVVAPDGQLAGVITAMDVLQALNEPPPESGIQPIASRTWYPG